MIYKIYTFLTGFLRLPYVKWMMPKRVRLGKEDSSRFREKFGLASIPRPAGKILWIHGASMGESLSVMPLIREIKKRYPHWNILMTSGTVTSARLVERRLSGDVIHQFMPLDFLPYVKRFMNYWTPDLVLWVESELWPHALHEIKRRQIKAISINTRISPKSLKLWSRMPEMFKRIMGTFTHIYPQTKALDQGLKDLHIENSTYIGNLKFSLRPDLTQIQETIDRLKPLMESRPCLMGASTHVGEEQFLIEAHRRLKEVYPDLLTVIAPRHPHRVEEILNLGGISHRNLFSHLGEEKDLGSQEFLVVDRMGVLNAFYTFKPLVFVGGSLIPHGGQTPIEPGYFGCSITFGPHMFNFKEVVEDMIAKGAALEVQSGEELIDLMKMLLDHPKKRQALERKAHDFVRDQGKILDAYLDALAPHLGGPK